MHIFRRVLALATVAGGMLFALSAPHTLQSSITPAVSECTPTAMAQGIDGAGSEKVVKVSSLWCQGRWAAVWADVAVGPESISVTDVMVWRSDFAQWRPVDRAYVCTPRILPATVYRQGCFSN